MVESIRQIANRISQLKIQGARNVAIAAIEALVKLSEETKAENKQEFLDDLFRAQTMLLSSRETEPLMRNAIKWIISQVEKSDGETINVLSKIVESSASQFLKNLEDSKMKIAAIGSKRIKNNSVVLTHCHSSTVIKLLTTANREGKNFEVFCTETRPLFQGRITAKELIKDGIKTTLIVDSAVRSIIKEIDLVIVGSDAITSEGNVINKIGTSTIALIAREARKPFYVVSELLKFDPATICGNYEKIEERDPSEVWKDAPKNLLFRNPAFDITRREFIHGVICEEGIIPPHSIFEVVNRKYEWIFK
ncbi:S-methyl-5-thioribose-1-phosphate isomerase [Candidatus Bathyarchaeota archaeon]|nr:S-methyl-5-thioribose-1-phosphate isomerase [Candidatus Bathyarchaeota archaeon]